MSNVALNNNNFINENGLVVPKPTASYTKFNEWYKIGEDENFDIWECCLYTTVTSAPSGSIYIYTPPTPNEANGDFWIANACMKRVSGSYPSGEQFPLPYCTYWYNYTDTYYEYINYKWYPYLNDNKQLTVSVSMSIKTNFTRIQCFFVTRLKLAK